MPKGFGDKLVIAISSRALFNLDASHQVYIKDGLAAYAQYQIDHEDEILEPGSNQCSTNRATFSKFSLQAM